MEAKNHNRKQGYTVVELAVTILIVSLLAVTGGVLIAKLFSVHERQREEAYVREKLADICSTYADFLSVGASIINTSTNATIVKFRQETGGISLETGLVTRVVYLTSSMNMTNNTMDLKVFALEPGEEDLDRRISRKIKRNGSGDAALIPLLGDMVSCTLEPLTQNSPTNVEEETYERLVPNADEFKTTGAALGLLTVRARYKVKNEDGELVSMPVEVKRVVRLWHWE